MQVDVKITRKDGAFPGNTGVFCWLHNNELYTFNADATHLIRKQIRLLLCQWGWNWQFPLWTTHHITEKQTSLQALSFTRERILLGCARTEHHWIKSHTLKVTYLTTSFQVRTGETHYFSLDKRLDYYCSCKVIIILICKWLMNCIYMALSLS